MLLWILASFLRCCLTLHEKKNTCYYSNKRKNIVMGVINYFKRKLEPFLKVFANRK